MEGLRSLLQAAAGLGQGTAAEDLASVTARVAAALRAKDALAGSDISEVLATVGALWNASIDMGHEQAEPREIAMVMQCTSELIATVPLGSLPQDTRASLVHILHKTGSSWAALQNYEAADAVYSKAMESAQWLQDMCFATRNWSSFEQDCGTLYFTLLIDRMEAGRQLNQQMLVSALISQARDFACDERIPAREACAYKLDLVQKLREQGTNFLQAGKAEQATPLLSLAYEVLATLDLEDGALAGKEAEISAMVCQVLTLLGWGYALNPDESERALSCIQALQQLDPQHANHFVLPFLSHKVFLQLGRFDEAQTELLNVISHEDVTPEICASAVKAALVAPESLQSTRSVLPMVFERFPEEASIILDLVEVLSSQPAASEELEALVLEVVGDDRSLELLREEPAQYARLHAILWNHATGLMEVQQFERALTFYSACLSVALEPKQRVQLLHAQALCCTNLRSFDRALQYIAAAEEVQPNNLLTGFLRLKTNLVAKNITSAAGAVTQLVACEGVTPDVLRVACIEALDAGIPEAAKQALLMLLESVSAGGSEQYESGYEATIFQNLVKIILDAMPAASDSAAMDSKNCTDASRQDPQPSRCSELAKYLDQAAQRMKAVGPSKFFAADDGKPMQQEWMAVTAWTAACEASSEKQMQQAAVLMGACGEFWAAHPHPTAATMSKQKAAFLFAAICALDVYDGKPEFDSALALAAQYLLAAKQAAASMQSGLPLGAAPVDAKADAFLMLMEFALATRQKDVKAQLGVIERAKAVPTFSADHFAKMAAPCKDGIHKNLDICRAAEQAALQRLTSEATLNYPVVAAILRSLVLLSKADTDKLQLLAEARGILKAAPKGVYPELELRWLLTTAWNRGAILSRLGHKEDACQYMQLGMELLALCPALAGHKEDMERAFAALYAEEGPPTVTPAHPAGASTIDDMVDT